MLGKVPLNTPNMTIAVDLDIQQKNQIYEQIRKMPKISVFTVAKISVYFVGMFL